MSEDQPMLFEAPAEWEKHWQGMPDFIQNNQKPDSCINVQFRRVEDRIAFLALMGEPPVRTRSIWYPKVSMATHSVRNAPPTVVDAGRYPIYVISKGRWRQRLTASALDQLGIEYHLVVEPQEYDSYAAEVDAEKIYTLPFSNLGQGSIPARNWVWNHALSQGCERHWILDDNLDGFYRLNNNTKHKIVDENPFIPVEEFVSRYGNVALAGMNYEFLAKARDPVPPYYLNTRIYSCILINHNIPHRWRGRYNEDTDLSIRVLKDGWCTVLFNAVLAKKKPTMSMVGGNTDELYKDDGRRKMAESLVEQHPDVATVSWKFNRWQHHVDYTPFKRNHLTPVALLEGAA